MKPLAYGLTDVGRCRESNQDTLLVDDDRGIYAVADGMGGHAAGEVASRIAIETLAESMESHSLNGVDADTAAVSLERALVAGNSKICESVVTRGEWRGMGTTIVAMLAVGKEAVIGHVGDSRAYLLRKGELHRLTDDHSWVSEQVKLGLMTDDEAHRHPMRNIVTRALGNRTELQVETTRASLEPGDVFMLCSDGLNSMLGDDEIRDLLVEHASDPQQASQALVESANRAGGEDNITVIVLTQPQQ